MYPSLVLYLTLYFKSCHYLSISGFLQFGSAYYRKPISVACQGLVINYYILHPALERLCGPVGQTQCIESDRLRDMYKLLMSTAAA